VIADLQGLKCGDSHIGYCAHIGIGFASDYDLQIHGFLLSPLCWLMHHLDQKPQAFGIRVNAFVVCFKS
jgi:hypothetical protein